MANKPKIKPMPFNAAKWISDPALRMLPPSLKGRYVDLLCYMWVSDEPGVMVKPNGKPYTRAEICDMMGAENQAWLEDLIELDLIYARDNDRAICSPLILRIREISNKRSEAGKKGGDVTKAKIFQVPIKEPDKEPKPKPKTNKQLTLPGLESPTDETPPTITEAAKKKAEDSKKIKYGEFVTLTRIEYAKLCERLTEDGAKDMIQKLDLYLGSSGKKYKSHYYTILSWINRDLENGNKRQGIPTPQNPGGGSSDPKRIQPGESQTFQGEGGGTDKETSQGYAQRF